MEKEDAVKRVLKDVAVVWNISSRRPLFHETNVATNFPFALKNLIYCIDTDEILGFFLLLKNDIFIARSEDTIFIRYVWGFWCRHGY